MKDNYTHILFIIDDSGSMRPLISDSIGGFNSFIKEQREAEGECRIHTMTFGSSGNINYIHKNLNVNEVPELTEKEHSANSGLTALYDAVGRGIQDLGSFLRDLDSKDRPAKVLVNIFTDGAENDSTEFTHADVKDMIEEQTNKYKWEFAFLASDMQSVNTAKNLGISNTAFSIDNAGGMRGVYSTVSANALSYRNHGKVINLQDEYDKEMEKES